MIIRRGVPGTAGHVGATAGSGNCHRQAVIRTPTVRPISIPPRCFALPCMGGRLRHGTHKVAKQPRTESRMRGGQTRSPQAGDRGRAYARAISWAGVDARHTNAVRELLDTGGREEGVVDPTDRRDCMPHKHPGQGAVQKKGARSKRAEGRLCATGCERGMMTQWWAAGPGTPPPRCCRATDACGILEETLSDRPM